MDNQPKVMREADLRKAAKCDFCNKPIGHTGVPLFWQLTVERYGIDFGAVKRQDGFAAMLGNSALASIMGTDEPMATAVMEPVTLTCCEECMIEKTGRTVALAFDKAAHEEAELTACPWCGLKGPNYDESPRPSAYCNHG